jgi:hypothetical protein
VAGVVRAGEAERQVTPEALRGGNLVRSVYDPDGLLRTFLDSGGLNLEINTTGPGGYSEASRAIFDASVLLRLPPRGQFAKPLFAGSNPAATSNFPDGGGGLHSDVHLGKLKSLLAAKNRYSLTHSLQPFSNRPNAGRFQLAPDLSIGSKSGVERKSFGAGARDLA